MSRHGRGGPRTGDARRAGSGRRVQLMWMSRHGRGGPRTGTPAARSAAAAGFGAPW